MHYVLPFTLSITRVQVGFVDETTARAGASDRPRPTLGQYISSVISFTAFRCLVRKCHPAEVNPHLVVFFPFLSHVLSLTLPPPLATHASFFPLSRPRCCQPRWNGNCCRRSLSPSLALSLRVKHKGDGSGGGGGGASFLALLILPSPSV